MTRTIAFFLLFATSLATTATAQPGYLSEFQQKWQNAASYTIEVAEAMPEETRQPRPFRPVGTNRAILNDLSKPCFVPTGRGCLCGICYPCYVPDGTIVQSLKF